MTEEQKAAYIVSQSVCAMCDTAAMQAENAIRMLRGESLAYGEEAFHNVIDKYEIDRNSVVMFLRG